MLADADQSYPPAAVFEIVIVFEVLEKAAPLKVILHVVAEGSPTSVKVRVQIVQGEVEGAT
jgi:hypothetical protein